MRKEYREVSFKFFSYNIPKDDESFRPWVISFDLEFFDFCQVWGGFLGFHYGRYSSFRPATARLLLWLKKLLFKNKQETPYYNVNCLCVNVLGFRREYEGHGLQQEAPPVCERARRRRNHRTTRRRRQRTLREEGKGKLPS